MGVYDKPPYMASDYLIDLKAERLHITTWPDTGKPKIYIHPKDEWRLKKIERDIAKLEELLNY